MIQDEILQQRAAKLNLTASDEDVNAKLTEIKAPYTQDQFYNLLKQRNLSLDDFKRDIRRQLTETKLINKEIESKINITDAQIAAFYSAHKADFNLIEPQYHLAQIVVTSMPAQQNGSLQGTSPQAMPMPREESMRRTTSLRAASTSATVAANVSEDPNTASNGGDMGFVRESQLKSDPAVYDAISKLKPDQFTDVLPVYDSGSGPQSHWLRHLQADFARARGPEGVERSTRAASHPSVASRQPEAASANRLSRVADG